MTHYSYGGGLSGCLYDYGPNYAEHKGDAVDALVWLYADGLAEGEP